MSTTTTHLVLKVDPRSTSRRLRGWLSIGQLTFVAALIAGQKLALEMLLRLIPLKAFQTCKRAVEYRFPISPAYLGLFQSHPNTPVQLGL